MDRSFEALHPRRPDGRFDTKAAAGPAGVTLTGPSREHEQITSAMSLTQEDLIGLPDADVRGYSIEATAGDVRVRIDLDDDGSEETVTYTYPAQPSQTTTTVQIQRRLPVELTTTIRLDDDHRLTGQADEDDLDPVIELDDGQGWTYTSENRCLIEPGGRVIDVADAGYCLGGSHARQGLVGQADLDEIVGERHPLHSRNHDLETVRAAMDRIDVFHAALAAGRRGLRNADGAYRHYRTREVYVPRRR